MGKRRIRAIAGGGLMIVAAIVLLSSISLSWYSTTGSYQGMIVTTVDFHPNDRVVVTNQGNSIIEGYNSPSFNLNNTGLLYTAVEGLMIGGGILGLIGAALGFMVGARPNLRRGAVICGVLAFILAIAGPAALAIAQPGALASDSHGAFQYGANTSAGPTNSFVGSVDTGGGTISWGPAIGFYLALLGGIIAIIGAILVLTARHEPVSTLALGAPVSVTAPSPGAPPIG